MNGYLRLPCVEVWGPMADNQKAARKLQPVTLEQKLRDAEDEADQLREDIELLRAAARAYLDARGAGRIEDYEREALEGLL